MLFANPVKDPANVEEADVFVCNVVLSLEWWNLKKFAQDVLDVAKQLKMLAQHVMEVDMNVRKSI